MCARHPRGFRRLARNARVGTGSSGGCPGDEVPRALARDRLYRSRRLRFAGSQRHSDLVRGPAVRPCRRVEERQPRNARRAQAARAGAAAAHARAAFEAPSRRPSCAVSRTASSSASGACRRSSAAALARARRAARSGQRHHLGREPLPGAGAERGGCLRADAADAEHRPRGRARARPALLSRTIRSSTSTPARITSRAWSTRFGGNVRLALAAYNIGPAHGRRLDARPTPLPGRSQAYVDNVFIAARAFRAYEALSVGALVTPLSSRASVGDFESSRSKKPSSDAIGGDPGHRFEQLRAVVAARAAARADRAAPRTGTRASDACSGFALSPMRTRPAGHHSTISESTCCSVRCAPRSTRTSAPWASSFITTGCASARRAEHVVEAHGRHADARASPRGTRAVREPVIAGVARHTARARLRPRSHRAPGDASRTRRSSAWRCTLRHSSA